MEVGDTSSTDASVDVGKYRLLTELGRGGMGTVFLAVAEGHAGLRKLVVLKILAPGLADDATARELFLAEARLAARLNHPNVVQTFEVGRESGRDVIVMEYLEGQSLAAVLRRARSSGESPMPLSMQLRVVADALQGLHYAHELADFDGAPLHIVHRDVSPQNLFVTYDGVAKLLDFGIAKAVTSSSTTADGTIKGKVPYLSPEQFAGESLDRRADVFSMGVVLWDIVAGKRLWSGMPDVAIMRELSAKAIPSPATARPDLDPALERIVMRAVAADRDDRYSTAEAFQLDVEAYLDRVGKHESPRTIGHYVSNLFQYVRASAKVKIEQRLREGGVDAGSGMAASVPTSDEPTGRRSGATGTNHAATLGTLTHARSWAAPIAIVAVGGLFAAIMLARAKPPATPSLVSSTSLSAPSTSAHSPSTLPAARRRVSLEVAATPPSAHVTLDDASIDNPTTLVVFADDRVHHLRAEAPGYFTRSRDVTFDVDSTTMLRLDAIDGASPPPSASAWTDLATPPATPPRAIGSVLRAVASAESSAARSSKPSAPCDPPFYIDDRGIKTLRPECR